MASLIQRIRVKEAPPRWGVLQAVIGLGVWFAFSALVGPSLVLMLEPPLSVALLAGWTVGGALTIAFVWRMVSPNAAEALRLTESPTPLLILFGIGLGAAVTLDLLAIPFDGRVLPPAELAGLLAPTPLLWAVAVVLMLVVQPLVDEMVFRGVVFAWLRAMAGVWLAIGMSSALYGLMHYLLYGGTSSVWYGLTEPLLAGLVMGVTRAATRSTRAAVAVHVGVGVFGVVKTALILSIL